MKNIVKILFLACVINASSCTNLDENAYDIIVADDFYKNKNEVISAVHTRMQMRGYHHQGRMDGGGQRNYPQINWPGRPKGGMEKMAANGKGCIIILGQ